jgi:transglutaminase-like putative cysteine protease
MWDDLQEWKHVLYVIAGGFVARLLYDRFNESRSEAYQKLQQRGEYSKWNALEPIPDGKAGTIATLKFMRAIVDRDSRDTYIRKVAEHIVRDCRGHDFLCEIKACFEFARDRITYRRDPLLHEYVQDSRQTLEAGVGDCDCKVVLLCSLLQSLGHRTRFVVLGQDNENFSHVYCEVLTKQHGWLPLDPTNEQAHVGWEAKARVKEAYPAYVN